MLKFIRESSGQTMFVEWALTIAVVLGAVTVMTAYVKRAYQARIYDADTFMLSKVGNAFGNLIALEYEPYYQDTASQKYYYSERYWTTGPGAFVLGYGDDGQSTTLTRQAPPMNYYLVE